MKSLVFGLLLAVLGLWGVSAADSAEPVYDVELVANKAYVHRDGKPLLADVMIPKPAAGQVQEKYPAVLVIHGGAWRSGNKYQLQFVGKMLAQRGFVAVLINYRLAPRHKFPAQYEDCVAALDWMRKNADQYHIDPDWIAAWGYSAGGHLAALLGTRLSLEEANAADGKLAAGNGKGAGDNGNGADENGNGSGASRGARVRGIQAVVAGGAPCDFRGLPLNSEFLAFWLGGTRAEFPDRYTAASPRQFVSPHTPPCCFYHGEEDAMVNLREPKNMIADLKKLNVPVELHVVEKSGHIFAMFDVKAVQAGVKFLENTHQGRMAEHGRR